MYYENKNYFFRIKLQRGTVILKIKANKKQSLDENASKQIEKNDKTKL